ncbi:MAG: hypothetical protein NZT92_18850 [Abditibacteriales bacterium]|nr:hypothetical protein [Abditibacteriales bacterium]MDW8367835.1 hypothetical protein [Abditibacteriales bacterium]
MKGLRTMRRMEWTLGMTACLVLSLCAVGWGNGEWHERAEKGHVETPETSSVPGSIKEGSQPLIIAPPPVTPPPQPSVSATASAPPSSGAARWLIFLAVSWLIAFVLLVWGVKMHLREQRRQTR